MDRPVCLLIDIGFFPAAGERTHITGSRKRALFREVNERIRDVNTTFGSITGTFDILCECTAAACDRRILVPGSVYEAVRAHAARYLVAPGHEQLRHEVVVEANGTYRLVETAGSGLPAAPR